MLVLGLDFETTGLNAANDRVIEVGAVLWDTDSKKPLALLSELINPGVSLSSEIIEITGIDQEMLEKYSQPGEQVFKRLEQLIAASDYVMAHNAAFDRSFYEAEMKRLGNAGQSIKWLDSMMDIPYGKDIEARKLTYLAADHGFVNPFSHRALFDTLTMLQVVSNYKFSEIVERSQSPSVEVISHVSFDQKDLAKKMGFRWDASAKKWKKNYKECDLTHIQFPFEISVNSATI